MENGNQYCYIGIFFIIGGFYKFISGDFEICFEQIAARREGAMRAL